MSVQPWTYRRFMYARDKYVLAAGEWHQLVLDDGWTWGEQKNLSMREMRAFLEANDGRLINRTVP